MANNLTYTDKYKLVKPNVNDTYDIEEFHNASMDKIDKGLIERCRRGNGVPTGAGTEGDLYYNTGEKHFYQCSGGTTWEKIPTGMMYEEGTAIKLTDVTETTAKINVDTVTTVRVAPTDDKIPTEKAVRIELDKKLDIDQGSGNKNKVFITDNAGKAALTNDLNVNDLTTRELQVNNVSKLTIYADSGDGPVLDADTKKIYYKNAVAENEIATIGNVAAEKTAREAADATLQANIDAEATTRAAQDTALQNDIDAEATTRLANDNTLGNRITAEVNRATGVEAGLRTDLNAEVTRSTDADNDHDNRLDSIEAGYLVKVETSDTTGTADGRIKFTANKSTENKTIDFHTGLTLNNNVLDVNQVTTIRDAATAKDNVFPSEKATRTELDKKEDLANKKQSVTTQSGFSSETDYPSMACMTRHVVRKGTYNDSTELQGDLVDDLSGGGDDGHKKRALSAYQGKILADMIADISTIGRYLSSWNCTTGKPGSDPKVIPYTYKSGDYYIVNSGGVAGYALIPDGSEYTGAPSTKTSPDEVKVNDVYRYDGSTWIHTSEARDINFEGIQGDPYDNKNLSDALHLKSSGIKTTDGAQYNPDSTKGYYIVLPVGNSNGDLIRISETIHDNEGICFSGANHKFMSAAFEFSNRKVTAFQTTPDNLHYPSEKLVKDELDKKLSLTGGELTSDLIIAATAKITLKQTTFGDTDAVTKKYVSDNYLKLSGGTLTGDLAMGGHAITGVAAPSNDGDAVNKKYVTDNYLKVRDDIPALSSIGGTAAADKYTIALTYKKLNNAHTETVASFDVPLATTALSGLMSPADKTALTNFMTNAEVDALFTGAW